MDNNLNEAKAIIDFMQRAITAQIPFLINNESVIEIQCDDVTGQSINLAVTIFHEAIHAKLHRIKLTNNVGSNALSESEYKDYIRS